MAPDESIKPKPPICSICYNGSCRGGTGCARGK